MVGTQLDSTHWDTLEQSQLLTTEQLATARQFAAALGSDVTAEVVLRNLVLRKWITPFQAERLLRGQSRGFFYDDYKVVDVLGLGGMGWIYQAVHTATGEVVALKAMRQDFRHDQGMLARFQQEANVGLRLHHPNIVQTYAMGTAGGLPYLTMEFVPGPSLHEVLVKQKRLPSEQACEMARQVALALDHAHRHGVIHRDVKPANVLIDQSGVARLLDFGLSMFQEGDSGAEFSFAMIFGHESVGTWEFAAPEQVAQSLAADARSDIYSLGATLFAALTGENPWARPKRIDEPSPPLRSVREIVPGVPAAVAAIVARMLADDPAERFASAADVANALAPWAKPESLQFDFAAILAERKRNIARKLAKSPSSRSAASAFGRSTARLGEVSSVANPVLGTGPGTVADIADSIPNWAEKSIAHDVLCGPAVKWADQPPRLGPAGLSLQTPHAPGRIPLQQDHVLVGRSGQCDLQIADPAISSRHCEFQFDGRQWWLTDLQSSNGTQVNGKTIQRRAIRPGDKIILGQSQRFVVAVPGRQFSSSTTDKSQKGLWVLAIVALLIVVSVLALWLSVVVLPSRP